MVYHHVGEIDVFPVPTGMNRPFVEKAIEAQCVPRAHGDEPLA